MKSEEPSALSNFLFSLLIFLFISEIQAGKLQQACSSSCGDITNISYPFRLKTDPVGCGDHDFELSCQSNKTILELHSGKYYILELHSGKYYVTRISYDECIISVVDINLANGSCSLPYKSLSTYAFYSNGIYFLNPSYYKHSYARFLNCSTNISDSAYRRLPCLSDQSYNVYVNYGGYFKEIYDLPKSFYCSFISKVPILEADRENPSYEAILQLLKSGFNLRWSVKGRNGIEAGNLSTHDLMV
ncbi:hypothetical protein Pint_22138 [Pistacia integerrima]|uniref:Uncharacterized protein n=1 Tax=Pistacia integerrima TaxID=434235 RepID=A0ACC0YJF7_9ROSI|nr:hypothetical protein Pint_22138 [Pistacia integerrima]